MGLSFPATLRSLTAVAVLSSAFASAQGPAAPPATTIVEPPTPLLPQRVGELAADLITTAEPAVIENVLGQPDYFLPENCLPRIKVPDDAARSASSGAVHCTAILKEDGLRRLAAGTYRRNSAGEPVDLFTLEFVDATGAESAFTFYRSLLRGVHSATGTARLASQALADSGGLLLLSGTSVVRVQGHVSDADLTALIAGLPKVTGRKALAPLLPRTFPADVSGTKPDLSTARYSLGPVGYQTMGGELPPEILGWDKSAEIATASYSGRSGKGTLTLFLYPTPQIAADRGRAIEQIVNQKGPASFGTVKLRRVGPLLGMTSGGFAPEQAQKLVEALHLNEVVTFDQKMPLEFHAEVKKTATLLEEILIFTGVLTIAALVIGIFLGGARAGWRVLHGKPAASEPEFLTIDLRDKPKALFAAKESGPGDSTP